MRIELELAFILHTRPFRDNSMILDCLTENYGRLSLLAKGVRSPKSKQKQLCQPFRPVWISWQGKSQLKTLTEIEAQAPSYNLLGKYLFSGFYLNELLTRLLLERDPCPEIFHRYHSALLQLTSEASLEPLLRHSELGFLHDLGYSVNLQLDSITGLPLDENNWYRYVPEQGLVATQADNSSECFQGGCLLAISRDDYSNVETLRQAKRLTRSLLRPLIGNKPLKSRELFSSIPSGGQV